MSLLSVLSQKADGSLTANVFWKSLANLVTVLNSKLWLLSSPLGRIGGNSRQLANVSFVYEPFVYVDFLWRQSMKSSREVNDIYLPIILAERSQNAIKSTIQSRHESQGRWKWLSTFRFRLHRSSTYYLVTSTYRINIEKGVPKIFWPKTGHMWLNNLAWMVFFFTRHVFWLDRYAPMTSNSTKNEHQFKAIFKNANIIWKHTNSIIDRSLNIFLWLSWGWCWST